MAMTEEEKRELADLRDKVKSQAEMEAQISKLARMESDRLEAEERLEARAAAQEVTERAHAARVVSAAFAVGTVVALKSGGERMTIEEICSQGAGANRTLASVLCVWFDPAGGIHREHLLEACLVEVT